MWHFKSTCVLFLCVFLLPACCLSANLFTPEQETNIDRFVEDLLSCLKVPGLILSVVKENKTFTKAYGLRDVENGVRATEDTLFSVGSLTKAMSVTLLSKLLPQKYPESLWDTKVKDVLGDSFKLYTSELSEHVTIKDMLTHRTGLASGDVYPGYPKNTSRAEVIRKLRFLPISRPLRYRYSYNNWMYVLAGYIAEVLAGDNSTWEDLLQRHVFDRLGMNSTVILKDLGKLVKSREVALPYFIENGKHTRMAYDIFSIHPFEPAGSVFSTARDVSSWLRFLLQSPGAPAIKDVVNQTAFRYIMQPFQLKQNYVSHRTTLTRPKFPVEMSVPSVGMGWFIGTYRGYNQVSHTGSLFAYRSILWLYPDIKAGLFVSVNAVAADGKRIKLVLAMFVSDLLMGETPWLNSTTACIFPQPWKGDESSSSSSSNTSTPEPSLATPEPLPQRPLSEYTGVYGHRLLGDIHISLNTSENTLQLDLWKFQALLFRTSEEDKFAAVITGAFRFFQRNASIPSGSIWFNRQNGKVQQVSYSNIGRRLIFDKNVRFSDKDVSQCSKLSYSFLNLVSVVVVFVTQTRLL